MSKGAQIALGALLVVALLAWYAYGALEGGSYRYYQTLEELRAADPSGSVRLHGYVAAGSIERDLAGKQVRFAVQNDPPHAVGAAGPGETLAVVYRSLETPDLFKDGAEVVVEGRIEGAGGVFFADNVLAKCPSKFQAEIADGGPAAPPDSDPARL
jgi:cytochrome c-type biogenesis protein CcmE